jgi:hypothetical protein
MSEANSIIGPAVGLPALPYVDFGDALLRERGDGIHWKSEPLLAYARGRPFAWVDDEQSEADRVYAAAHHEAPALLHGVSPSVGLRPEDFAVLKEFAISFGARCHMRSHGAEADQPGDENNQRDPPQDMNGEAETAENQRDQ